MLLVCLQCEGLLEEHEEDIIGLLRNSETDLLTKICVDMAGESHLCTGHPLKPGAVEYIGIADILTY